jgi:hypothetical protein
MSTRERWIVYPLLFLALGAALRDKFVGSRDLRAGAVTCGELRVGRLLCDRLESGQVSVLELHGAHLVCDRVESGQSECRQLIVKGPNGQPVVGALADSRSGNGMIETVSATGMPLVEIASANGAGNVVVTGRVGNGFGVLAQLPELGLRLPFGLPWGYDDHTNTPPEGQKKIAPPKKTPETPKKSETTKNGANNRDGGK